ncbi:Hint domain-containing protein [Terrisporobacter petrolearius]
MNAVCFVAGTLVSTEKGLVPIEDIKEGDLVWSQNPETS